MNREKLRQFSFIFLALVIVFIFLWNGIPKVMDPGMISGKFVSMGFAGWLGPIIGWFEVIAAVLIVVGVWHSRMNLLLAAIIAVALVGVHIPNGVTASLQRDFLILASTLLLAVEGNWFHPMKKKKG